MEAERLVRAEGNAELSKVLFENLIQSAKSGLKEKRRMPECPHIQVFYLP